MRWGIELYGFLENLHFGDVIKINTIMTCYDFYMNANKRPFHITGFDASMGQLTNKGWNIIYTCISRHAAGDISNTWWRHQMETFSALLAICAGNSPVTGEFPTQRPVTQSFDVLEKRANWNEISLKTAHFYNAYPQETGAVLSEISFQFAR